MAVTAWAANPQTFINSAGIYPLIGHGVAASSGTVTTCLTNAYTAGVSCRSEWWTIEPTEDNYDWSYIDSYIDRANDYGKKVIIRVRPAWQTPDWVYDAGAEEVWYYERNDADNLHRMPPPWDPVFKVKWADFVADMGARYNNNPDVAIIHVTGCTRSDCEMYLPANADMQAGEPTWEARGYTPSLMISTWEDCIDTWTSAFPNKLLSISASTVLYDDGVVEGVTQYAKDNYPWHVACKISNWHNNNSPTYYPHEAMTAVVDEYTFGGEEAVGAIGGGTQAEYNDAILDAIGWHGVFYMEPYPGNQVTWLGASAYPAENTKYKAMVSSTAFNAQDGQSGQSQLTWTNPSGYSGFQQVKILRKTGGYPAGSNDASATVVYQGTAQSYLNTGLTNGTKYYYAMYELPSTYTIAQDTATPVAGDTTPPGNVSSFLATAGNQQIQLTWNNPGDADLTGIKIQRSTSAYPATPDGGTTVYNQLGTSHLDTGLTNGVTYYYSAFAYDEVPNYASGTGAAATPQASSATLLEDGFELNFNLWTDGGTTDWDRPGATKYSGIYSAHAGPSDNDLISDNLNSTGYGSMTIEFWYRDDDIDADDDIYLQLYNGSTYTNKFELDLSTEDTWTFYTVTINNSGGDAQYFRSNFRIKFEGTSLDTGENLWIDDVKVTAQ